MNIREEVNKINEEILSLEEDRANLQGQCNHPETHEVDYMWRPGATSKVLMCSDCGYVVKNLDISLTDQKVTVTCSDFSCVRDFCDGVNHVYGSN